MGKSGPGVQRGSRGGARAGQRGARGGAAEGEAVADREGERGDFEPLFIDFSSFFQGFRGVLAWFRHEETLQSAEEKMRREAEQARSMNFSICGYTSLYRLQECLA